MYEVKFQKGDIIKPRDDKPRIFHHNWDDLIFEVIEIVRTNNTFYYKFNNSHLEDFNNPLFPAIDVDNYYELDKIYLRKEKLQNIIYNTKPKQTN